MSLRSGDLSLVIPKSVEDIYNVIIKGTPFEFTKLKIEVVEGQGICRDCKRAFPIVKNEGYCPRCGKRNADVISGRDFLVKESLFPEPRTLCATLINRPGRQPGRFIISPD